MKDSGLQHAMRALLGIIAGLLIADMLKNMVNTVRYSPPDARFSNVLIVIGAALFLSRVVVDNILFYELDDRTASAYVRRVFLLGLDLTSYAICYFIVAELEPSNTKDWRSFAASVPLIMGAFAVVESLHMLWCVFWLWALRDITMEAKEKSRRVERLKAWGLLSGRFAVLAGVLTAWFAIRPPPYDVATAILAGCSVFSLVTYLATMKKHYTGTAEQWAETITPPNSAPSQP